MNDDEVPPPRTPGRIVWKTPGPVDPSAGGQPPSRRPEAQPPAANRATPTRRTPPRFNPAPTPSHPVEQPATPTIDRLGRDLSALARRGAFDDLFVREALLLRLARALLHGSKPNPMLLGEAGVGKTALVEALARRLTSGALDERLAGLRLVELPLAALVAGASFRGQLEERLLALLTEAKQRPDIVLFIDEAHLLAEQGGGAGEIANILKPALARGELRCIGATTPAEYDRAIRPDAALARRFQIVLIEEPDADETAALLRRLAPGLETRYRLRIEPAALDAAIALATGYLRDRRLPDSAIDLLHDACTRAILPGLEPALGDVAPVVGAETVAAAVAERTGAPLTHLTGRLGGGQIDVEAALRADVLGQEAAVSAVAGTVRLARLGLRGQDRPRGVFLFGGPSGVGKTALARSLARAVGGDERALLRIDLSEYQEQHGVARLIGAPPGYIGHETGGQLTNHLRRWPASVVLLDEIEKAHPRVLDLFLQVFDAGRITDGRGAIVDARQAYFALTTNLPLDDRDALHAHLRPEFLNRIDHILGFNQLALEQLLAIAQREIDLLIAPLALRGVTLDVDRLAMLALCRDDAPDLPANGRSVIRRVEQEIAAPLALLLERSPHAPAHVQARVADGTVRLVADAAPGRSEPATG